jgi:hypothetical protein
MRAGVLPILLAFLANARITSNMSQKERKEPIVSLYPGMSVQGQMITVQKTKRKKPIKNEKYRRMVLGLPAEAPKEVRKP